jgi:ribosome-binding factor A
MSGASPRMLKVNSTIKQVLAEEIERLNDTRLDLVSVTAVDTSPDLRHAMVFIDVLGSDRTDDALAALKKASRRLQSAIGRQVRMKFTPTLEFMVDPGVIAGERIESILREIDQGRDGEDE